MPPEIDAYVLISHGSGMDTQDIGGGSGPGRWRGRGVGAFDAVVALAASNLPDLHDQVHRIREGKGPIRLVTLVAVRPLPAKVKRTSLGPGEVMAFVTIDARPGQVQAVFDEVERRVAAACIVTGSADILAEIHASNIEGLWNQAEGLGSIEGVRKTRTTYIQPQGEERANATT